MLLIDAGDVRWELPPRARRIPAPPPPQGGTMGTTSACAENTLLPRNPARKPGNYLRVRGEYHVVDTINKGSVELPPRARRILPWGGDED